jgi:D-glycerate 3-kinase
VNQIATIVAAHIAQWLTLGEPLIVGICGTQASGKSTACEQVAAHLDALGLSVGVLGLDDLYFGRVVRAELAARVHPLFATRGPPGTHDVALGMEVLSAVKRGKAVRLPRFDKRADEPLPEEKWPELGAHCDVLLFEGWCVDARAQDELALAEPVNDLERDDDPGAIWRRAFNAELAGATGALFAQIDRLVYLRPPGWETVYNWRCQQEHAYLKTDQPAGASAAMTDAQVARFIAHYERMTRHMIAEMPDRADLTVQLDEARNVVSTRTAIPVSKDV